MRRGLSFLILLVVAVPLGWFAYYDSKKEAPSDIPKKDKVFTVEADKIDELTIKSESGDHTMLKKNGASWEIVQPAGTRTDDSAVSGITSNLASVEMQRVIEESPSDLKDFGLAEPRVEVTFKAAGKEQKLQIGAKTPTGSDVYAKIGDQKKVFLISSYLDSTFNKSTFDLRDKAALKVERDKIDVLEVTAGPKSTTFEKKNGEWQLSGGARGDSGAIEGLVGKVAGAQMKAMTAPEATDLKQYGLDKPAATVRIGSGSSQATLLVGSAAAEGTVYAKDLSRPPVFTIESGVLDDLKKDPSDYRQKDLFDARSFNSTRVEIVRGGQTIAFAKATVKDKDGKDEQKWRQVAPAEKDVDGAKVDSFISAVTAARATSFVDSTAKTGLDKPELTVAIKYDEGKKEDRVAFAKSGSDGYASRVGSPGAAKIDATTIDSIVKALDEAQAPPPKPAEAAKAPEKK